MRAPAGMQVTIDKLAVHGGAVDFTDDGAGAAVRLGRVELAAATLGWAGRWRSRPVSAARSRWPAPRA